MNTTPPQEAGRWRSPARPHPGRTGTTAGRAGNRHDATPAPDGPPLLSAALAYAARGWRVFPLIPATKRPATPGHREADCDRTDPRCRAGHTGWQDRATTDPDRITRAWTGRAYGIGIACGPSRLLVIDTDTPKTGAPVPAPWRDRPAGQRPVTGEDVLAALAAEHRGPLPPTWTVTTPSSGVHRYYALNHTRADQATCRAQLGNSAGLLGWLIDTRGHGGYVVAPPTTTTDGRYVLTADMETAPLPAWLTGLLTRHTPRPAGPVPPARVPGARDPEPGNVHAYVNAAIDGESAKVRQAVTGTRNRALFCAAVALGQLVAGRALAEHDARAALLAACETHLATGGFTADEADATITSGLTTGARNPRNPATNERHAA